MKRKGADPVRHHDVKFLFLFSPQAQPTFLLSRWWHKHVGGDLAAGGRPTEEEGAVVQYVDTAEAKGNGASAADQTNLIGGDVWPGKTHRTRAASL